MTLYTLTTIVLSGVGLLLFDEQRDFQVPMSSPLSPVSGTTIIGFLIMFSAHVLNLYLSGPIVVKPEQIEYASTAPISKSHSSIPKKKLKQKNVVQIQRILNFLWLLHLWLHVMFLLHLMKVVVQEIIFC